MPFDAGSIVAKLKLDKSQFSTGLKSGVQEAQKFDLAMGKIFVGGAMVAGIAIATKKIFELARAGAELKRLEDSFNRVAEAAGTSPRSIISGARATSGGAFSDQQIMIFTNRLVAAGVGVNNLSHLMRIANATAAATGKTQSAVLEKMISDLDHARYANSKLNEMLREGDKLVEDFGTHSDDFGTKLDALGAMFVNIGNNIKKDMLPFLNAVVTGVSWLLKQAGSSPWMGINGATKDNETLGPSLTPGQLMGANLRARNEAEARAWLENLMRPKRKAANQVRPMGSGNTFFGLDWSSPDNPALKMGETFTQQFDLMQQGLSALGDSFAGFFEMLVTDSGNAGKAFFAGIMGGLAGIASNLGDFFIEMGIGIHAIKHLSGTQAILAGIALKALSGVMRGIAFNNAPVSSAGSSARSLRQPLSTDGSYGSTTIIVQGDFIGDRVWVDRLADMIRKAQRNRGAPSPVFRMA